MLIVLIPGNAYLHVPIVKHHNHFYVCENKSYQQKGLPSGLATVPKVFFSHIKPILFFCQYKGFHLIIYLDDILVLIHFKHADKIT